MSVRIVVIHSSSLPCPSYKVLALPVLRCIRRRQPPKTKSIRLPLSTRTTSDKFTSPESLGIGHVCASSYQITRRFVISTGPHEPPNCPLCRAPTPSRISSSPSCKDGLGKFGSEPPRMSFTLVRKPMMPLSYGRSLTASRYNAYLNRGESLAGANALAHMLGEPESASLKHDSRHLCVDSVLSLPRYSQMVHLGLALVVSC